MRGPPLPGLWCRLSQWVTSYCLQSPRFALFAHPWVGSRSPRSDGANAVFSSLSRRRRPPARFLLCVVARTTGLAIHNVPAAALQRGFGIARLPLPFDHECVAVCCVSVRFIFPGIACSPPGWLWNVPMVVSACPYHRSPNHHYDDSYQSGVSVATGRLRCVSELPHETVPLLRPFQLYLVWAQVPFSV